MKIILLILLTLLLSMTTVFAQDTADFKPSDYREWTDKDDDKKKAGLFGGIIQNYQKPDSSWGEIENDWVIEGDSVIVNKKAILKTKVRYNGQSTVDIQFKNKQFQVTKQLKGMYLIRKGDWARFAIDDTPDYSNINVTSNLVKWTNVFPAVDYQILKTNGTLAHQITFRPSFLNNVVDLYNGRSDSSDLFLANVMEVTLSAGIDNHDVEIGNVNKRVLKKIGKYVFQFEGQHLSYPGWMDYPEIEVFQRWQIINDKMFCIEAVKMSDIKMAHMIDQTVAIMHNDSMTFDFNQTLDGYFFGDDSFSQYINTNSHRIGEIDRTSNTTYYVDFSSISSGSTIDSTYFQIEKTNSGTDTVWLAVMTTEWDLEANTVGNWDTTKHGPTWFHARDSVGTTFDLEWFDDSTFTSADYDDNSGNYFGSLQSVADFKAFIKEGEQSVGNISQTISDWVDGDVTNYGWCFLDSSNGGKQYRPAEVFLDFLRPFVYVEWTEGAPDTTGIPLRRRKVLLSRRLRQENEMIYKPVHNDWDAISDLIYQNEGMTR